MFRTQLYGVHPNEDDAREHMVVLNGVSVGGSLLSVVYIGP